MRLYDTILKSGFWDVFELCIFILELNYLVMSYFLDVSFGVGIFIF